MITVDRRVRKMVRRKIHEFLTRLLADLRIGMLSPFFPPTEQSADLVDIHRRLPTGRQLLLQGLRMLSYMVRTSLCH